MRQQSIQLVVCPNCSNRDLRFDVFREERGVVVVGRLICDGCGVWYRIENGITDLLPLHLRRNGLYSDFIKRYNLVLDFKKNDTDQYGHKSSQIQFFKEKHDHYEERIVNSSFYQALDERLFTAWIQSELHKGNQAVDIGCGSGRQCVLLARHGIDVVGVDISEEMLLLAAEKLKRLGLDQGIDLIVADAENPPFVANCFDAGIFYGILHHLAYRQVAIRNISQTIKPGGLFYSLDPHRSPVRFIFDLMMKHWKLYEDEASEFPLLSSRELSEWLSAAGMQSTFGYSTYLPPHLLYGLNKQTTMRLLKYSDAVLNKIPGLRYLAGVIVAHGKKTVHSRGDPSS